MATKGDAFSPLVLDELFAAGDERFLDHLIQFHEPKKLAALADRWKLDARPWARRAIITYLEQLPASPGHEPVVKRLFKHAEGRGDDELMAHFAYAFDRLVRRHRTTRWRWDPTLRQSTRGEHLASSSDTLPKFKKPPRAGEPPWAGNRLFSYRTRHHLRRRAWRYFRRMGHQQPTRYPQAVAAILRTYADAILNSGENLLDSRSLMHACFRGSDVLDFSPAHVNLGPGRSLVELQAAPAHPQLWQRPASADVLLDLIVTANARPVRAWAVQVLRRFHFDPPPALSPERLLPLLDHGDDLVQQLGAELLARAVGLEALAFDDWLRLLQTRNLTALEIVARVMRSHVTSERVTLAQAVDLATARPVPIARVGLDLLRGKTVSSPEDRQTVARLANAQSAAVAGELTRLALGILGAADVYDVDLVVRFFDALLRPAREAAWAWLTAVPRPLADDDTSAPRSSFDPSPEGPRPRAYDDPALWSRLIETPYDDLRLRLVEDLKRRATLPGVAAERLGSAVWAPVLLGIHRGGRSKLTALRQVGDAVARDPAGAAPLLPVLAVAIRSVRLPEARHGLAAIVGAVDANPLLMDAVRKHLPELDLGTPAQWEAGAACR